jgi:hypothetical protein
MCNIPFYSVHFPLTNLFGIGTKFSGPKLWSVKLREMNVSDTVFFTSSIEAPKLQRPSKTFVTSKEKNLLLKEQPKRGLRPSSMELLTRVTLCARDGIWWDMEGIVHYELLERNLTVTA